MTEKKKTNPEGKEGERGVVVNEIAATYAIVVVESVINEKGMEIPKDDKPSRLLFVPACLINLCQRH